MNIEDLNSCFDAMSPTREQKDRIFAGIMSAKQQPVKIVKFHRYATAAAAVIVLGAFAAVYSNMGTSDIVNPVDKTIIAVENQKNNGENITEEVIETDEILPETNNVQAEKKGLADLIAEEYSEIAEKSTENVKVAVEEDTSLSMNKEADTDSVSTETPIVVSDAGTVASASASRGGEGASIGGASAYRTVEAENITLEQIMNDSVYADLFPTFFADFQFISAKKTYYDLNAVFNDNQGRYMSVWIISGGTFDFREDVVKSVDIINLKSEYGFFNFAVNCGEYYVIYNVESDDASQVYEMVISSAYFKN